MYFHKADFGSGVAVNQNAKTVICTCAHENLNFFSTFESFVNRNGSSSDLWWGKYWKYATGQTVNQESERNEEQHAHDKS